MEVAVLLCFCGLFLSFKAQIWPGLQSMAFFDLQKVRGGSFSRFIGG